MNFQNKPTIDLLSDASKAPAVLHIIDNLGLGGAQQLLLTLASSEGPRMPFRVVSLRHKENSIAGELQSNGIASTILRSNGLRSITSWIRLYRLLKQAPEKIVHLHLTDATIMAAPLAKMLGKKVVVSLHNVAGPPQVRRNAWLIDRLETYQLKNCVDIVIAVGRAVYQTNEVRIPPGRMQTILNVVTAPEPLPASTRTAVRQAIGATEAQLVVFTAGRLSLQKDHLTLLSAFAQVVRDHPTAVLWIAGDGKMRGIIEEAIAALSLENNVRLLGYRNDVSQLMLASDLFVLSSAWEGLPLTLVEAMARGLPVVATRVGEMPDVVTEGSGIVVQPKDPPMLAEAISRLLADSELRQRMSEGAKIAVIPYLDVVGWKSELLGIYRRLD